MTNCEHALVARDKHYRTSDTAPETKRPTAPVVTRGGIRVTALELSGRTLQAVSADYTVQLQMTDGCFVAVGSTFSLRSVERTITLNSETDAGRALDRLRPLIGQSVNTAVADSTGALCIRFSDGADLSVEADAAYQAWTVSAPHGALVVCTIILLNYEAGRFRHYSRLIGSHV